MNLREDFETVRAASNDGEHWRALPLERHGVNAEVAIDGEAHLHLLVPVQVSDRIASDVRSAGIQIGRYTLVNEDGYRRAFLDIVCRKPHLYDLFYTIAGEMLESIGTSDDPPDRVAIRILDRWRDLLAREHTGGPSLQVLMGVFGELWHLRAIAQVDPMAISVWKGPEGGTHDFRAGPIALEVKTTRKTGWRISIAGLHQLTIPEKGRLFLSIFRLETSGGGESLQDLLDALQTLGADAHFIHSRLADAGIAPGDLAEVCTAHRFEILEHRVYGVEPGFPRLTADTVGPLPTGVTAVKYDIDLTAWSGEPLSAQEVATMHDLFGTA